MWIVSLWLFVCFLLFAFFTVTEAFQCLARSAPLKDDLPFTQTCDAGATNPSEYSGALEYFLPADLMWERADFAGNGVHPSKSRRQKVAEPLLDFMTNAP